MGSTARFGLVCAALVAGACAAPGSHFSEANARAHVDMLAGRIGSRPTGTDANRRAREYVIDRLRLYGFDVRVQDADGVRPEVGRTVHVANIIATKAGARREAIALVAHYDSPPESPGAADDGLGVALCLEAGRVLASRAHPTYSLTIALTDGEELGLMGAAALVKDPAFEPVGAYMNFESIGTSGPGFLFQEGPGNPWLARAWARHAVAPAGGSWIEEIYRRLPNDTDFTILARTGTPGLNFAPVRDSYPYHTPRDVPDRLSLETIRQMGDSAVAIVEALDREDLTERSPDRASYFDVAGATAVAFGPHTSVLLVGLALAGGLVAWIRLLVVAARRRQLARLAIGGVWIVVVVAGMAGAMVAAAWALRESRTVYHPWYAHPDRFLALLTSAAVAGMWIVRRVRLALPRVARGSGEPTAVWAITLPAWTALVATAGILLPAASPVAAVPLLAAAVALLIVPLRRVLAVRVASAVVLSVAAIAWLGPSIDLFRFAVAALGRIGVVTPLYVYPALLLACAIFLAPPALAVVVGRRHRLWVRRSWRAALLLAVACTAILTYLAPAYTPDRPLRRSVRYIEDQRGAQAYFEIGGNEPGLDLDQRVPGIEGWHIARGQAPVGFPVGPPTAPFAFRARTTTMTPAPADVRASRRFEDGETTLEVSVFPRIPGIAVVFAMPWGVMPRNASLAGITRSGRWMATYVAPPASGLTFTARFPGDRTTELASTQVIISDAGLPGGEGWQRLPPWLHRDRVVWTARSLFILPAFQN